MQLLYLVTDDPLGSKIRPTKTAYAIIPMIYGEREKHKAPKGQVYQAMETVSMPWLSSYISFVKTTKILVHYNGSISFHEKYTTDYTNTLSGLTLEQFLER